MKEARTLKAEILGKENKEQDMSLGLDLLQMTDSLSIRDSLPRTDSLRISEE